MRKKKESIEYEWTALKPLIVTVKKQNHEYEKFIV